MPRLSNVRQILVLIFCGFLVLSLASCAYRDRMAPLQLPDPERGAVVVNGVMISATAFVDAAQARQSFGFDARRAGLLAVQITLQNDSAYQVVVNPDQSFLVDQENQAWLPLSQSRAHDRAKDQVVVGETVRAAGRPALLLGAAGAVVGAAFGLVTGENVGAAAGKGAVIGGAAGVLVGGAQGHAEIGDRIRRDLAEKTLRSSPILPKQIGHGVLFFPGKPGEEADSAKELRLALKIGQQQHFVILPLFSR